MLLPSEVSTSGSPLPPIPPPPTGSGPGPAAAAEPQNLIRLCRLTSVPSVRPLMLQTQAGSPMLTAYYVALYMAKEDLLAGG